MDAGWREMPSVGQTASQSRLITRRDIELFGRLTGHGALPGDEPALSSLFGQPVVPGGVSTAVLNALIVNELPGPGSVLVHLDVRFRAPVRPGDVITGAVRVTAVRADKPITTLRVAITRDDGVLAVEGSAVCYTAPPDR